MSSTAPTAAEIADGLDAKQVGDNRWMARCPAHDDRSPSLSIRESTQGKVLVHCFSGCPNEAVIDALRSMGLWQREDPVRAANRLAQRERERERDHARVVLAIAEADRKTGIARQWSRTDRATVKHARNVLGVPAGRTYRPRAQRKHRSKSTPERGAQANARSSL